MLSLIVHELIAESILMIYIYVYTMGNFTCLIFYLLVSLEHVPEVHSLFFLYKFVPAISDGFLFCYSFCASFDKWKLIFKLIFCIEFSLYLYWCDCLFSWYVNVYPIDVCLMCSGNSCFACPDFVVRSIQQPIDPYVLQLENFQLFRFDYVLKSCEPIWSLPMWFWIP